MPRRLFVLYVLLVLFRGPLFAAAAPDLDERTREIASELRCVVCQNLSVADSPSEMAQQMRAIVREQVQAGKTAEQIQDFFVSKYGEWVLLKPKTTGFSALLWILPYVVLVIGVIAALLFVRRIAARKKLAKESTVPAPISDQTRSELLRQDIEIPDIDDNSPRAELLRERARLRAELTELDFDYQSGKLSEPDYQALKRDVEAKGAGVIQQLTALPAKTVTPATAKAARAKSVNDAPAPSRFRSWQIVTGGVFLLLFGLALGVMLTKSIRPRQGENDTMTGDFMTGTAPANSEAGAALAEGKQAFSRQEFPKAIEAFKKVLATDPDNPEAHSYMGFILMQAGHGDGALLAFDKALSRAPNFPMALWGRGMVLYQDKKDFSGAREVFERLLKLVPPGEERNEVAKVLAEIPTTGGTPNAKFRSCTSSDAIRPNDLRQNHHRSKVKRQDRSPSRAFYHREISRRRRRPTPGRQKDRQSDISTELLPRPRKCHDARHPLHRQDQHRRPIRQGRQSNHPRRRRFNRRVQKESSRSGDEECGCDT